MRITLIKGGFSEYRRVVQQWWTELTHHFEETLLEFRPIYSPRANMTAFSDLLCGFVPAERDRILRSRSTRSSTDLNAGGARPRLTATNRTWRPPLPRDARLFAGVGSRRPAVCRDGGGGRHPELQTGVRRSIFPPRSSI